MHLSEIYAENFRIFGNEKDEKHLQLRLNHGITALIGENDAGKSAIVDAIRFCLWTTSTEYHRITEDDFHVSGNGREMNLCIRCKFSDLSTAEKGQFHEHLTIDDGSGEPHLFVCLQAERLDSETSRVAVRINSGDKGKGIAIDGRVRELLRATYLKPLRDAESQLSAGRGSRLSQILGGHPSIKAESIDDFDQAAGTATTLVGIMRQAEAKINANAAISSAQKEINNSYLSKLSVGSQILKGLIGVSGDPSLSKILEKLELSFDVETGRALPTRRGLGFNNALFMSTELLLLGARKPTPVLLIEEPEAHLHPQLQSRVMELLVKQSDEEAKERTQIILTTHSPNLAASLPVESIVLVHGANTFPLYKGETKLTASDYAFLRRFLDVTKSNLFFAKGVILVEGDAESLLLPTIAESIGKSLSAAGVSIVNVGHVGLFRYARIFQRALSSAQAPPIPVACIADRDFDPKENPNPTPDNVSERLASKMKYDGEPVKTFVSDCYTFEYDLIRASWKMAEVMHVAITLAGKSNLDSLDDKQREVLVTKAKSEVGDLKSAGKQLKDIAEDIFQPLRGNTSKAITAMVAADLLADYSLSGSDLPRYLCDAFNHVVG